MQPVAIRYLRNGQPCSVAPFIGDDDMLSHLLRLLGSDLGEVQIQLLTPIASAELNRNALARAAQQAIRQALFGAASPEPTAVAKHQAA